MRVLSFLLLFCCSLQPAFSQTTPYTPDWASLDKRPTPSWWLDGKFGIFIHWGVYSVPAYTKKGQYAEWYQYALMDSTNDGTVRKYHEQNYGNRSYYDLAQDFHAELFNPDEWAKLFHDAGAKYVVLTSKHHDGYCLWPNQQASLTWGFPWSSDEVGPRRDLVGDLFRALNKTDVKPGLYFSLFEWFNPLWQFDKERYAREHAIPQLHDLVNRYEPWVIWTDGDWEATPEQWKSQEFLAWLYDDSAVRDKVVTNDRWGSGARFKHGGVYTPEYQPDLDFEDHAWEESRGMGYSYGYNRAEDAWDYNSAQSLVLQLIDKVSRGGNFLLDIGPDSHGKIPPIMQERLLEMGKWLSINGEAIYNTRRWRNASQWSEGRRDWKGEGDALLKQTVDPDPGFAVKELFFTWNPNTKAVYAIFPKWPDNRQITIKNVQLPVGGEVSLLGAKGTLKAENIGGNVVITLPEYNPNRFKTDYAYALRIKGMGDFVAKPKIEVEYDPSSAKAIVHISCATPGAVIRYTLDGTEPKESSRPYTAVLLPDSACTVRARTYKAGFLPGNEASARVKSYPLMPSMSLLRAPEPGLTAFTLTSDKYSSETVLSSRLENGKVAYDFNLNDICAEKCGMLWRGYFNAPKTGAYHFSLESDDGSLLFLDGVKVVDNDGDHGMVEKSEIAYLQQGWHSLKVVYFNSGGGYGLKVRYTPPGGEMKEMERTLLAH